MLAARTLSQTIAERARGATGDPQLQDWIDSTHGLHDRAHVDAESVALALEELDMSPTPQAPSRQRPARKNPLRPILMTVGVAAMSAVFVQWRLTSLHFTSGVGPEPVSTASMTDAAATPPSISTTSTTPSITAEPDASRPVGAPTAEPGTPREAQEAIEHSETRADVAQPEPAPNPAIEKSMAASTDIQTDGEGKAQVDAEGAKANKEDVARQTLTQGQSPAAHQVAVAALAAPSALPKKSSPEKSSSDKSGDAAEPAKSSPPPSSPTSSGSPPSARAGIADLESGRSLFAKGNLIGARQAFEKAARAGLPEGALALGNTYDPVSLGKLGIPFKGDAVVARQWYRRAHEIAMQKPIASAVHAANTSN